MKLKFLLAIITLGFFSCQSKIELNKYDFDSVKDYALNAIKEKDSTSFMKLFDLSSPEFKLSRFSSNPTSIKKIVSENFIKAYKTIENSKIEFIKYDFSDALFGGEIIDDSSFIIYIKSKEIFYRLRFPTYNDYNKDANSLVLFYFENLSNECADFKNKPHIPTMLMKKELLWNNMEKKRFDIVALKLQNLTEYNIEKVQYRISITRKSDSELIFMKTLESEVSINKGDMGNMIIKGLKDVYLGEKLTGNFSWSVEILDVLPKPAQNPCKKIENIVKP